jgi:tape measure domain-containing protein
MAQRQAILDFKTTGDGPARSRVVSLADALERQKRNADRLAPSLKTASAQAGVLGAVSQSATSRLGSLTNTIGPLGAGLGHMGRTAPMAAVGLLQLASAAERASLMNRALNTTILAGLTATTAAGVTMLAMADDAIRAGDTYATLTARIRTFSLGAIEAAQVERELYANAKDARTAIEGQVTLYTRLAPAVRDYGRTQEEALKITELTTKTMAIQGADIREQAAATVQFSQSIASGVMRGDELRSLLESSPQLLRYIARNLEINGKIGVAFSQLRNLGEEGMLTTERIMAAMLAAEPQIEADFINAPKKAQQGWQRLTDTITRTVGQMSKATGAQEGLVDWLGDLADKADAFREKMLLDPSALDPVKQAAGFIGDAVGAVGQLGGVAVEHFDEIVMAGQAIIALKLGEVMASWFAAAANGARGALANLQTYQAAARASAISTLNPTAAAAAGGLRDGALALQIRAAEQAAQAEIKLAQATAMRTAADRAAVQAALAKAQVGAGSAAAAQAEATATAAATVAKRAEEQATRAQAAAKAAASAASLRNAAALEAEAVASANVTRAMVTQGTVMRTLNGLYAAMGGAVGVVGLAVGALIYAIWRAEQAYRAQVEAQRDALVVSDDLARITDAMTASTWAQIPALQARAVALQQEAVKAREAAEAQLALAEARRETLKNEMWRAPGLVHEVARQDRIARDTAGNLEAARKDEFAAGQETIRQNLTARTIEASTIQRQLSSGKDVAGRALTAQDREQLTARRTELFQLGQRQVDAWDVHQRQQQAAMEREQDPKRKEELRKGLGLFAANFQTAAELVATADSAPTGSPTATKAAKGTRTTVPGGVQQALTELIEQQYRNTGGQKDFTLKGGLITRADGSIFTARSEDEAAAAAKYVKQIEAINSATDAQIAKAGKSREALREAASAMLAAEVATSKASQADEKWADIRAEMTGQSRAVVKAEREISDLIADGADITERAAQAYVDYVAARERAQRMRQALQIAEPAARAAFDTATAGLVIPSDARGVPDAAAAAAQLATVREQILIQSEARIREELGRLREAEGLTEQQYAARLADAIAANRIAVETVVQDRLLQLEQDRLRAASEYAERRYAETADIIVGALDTARRGDWAQAGKDLVDDLLTAAYQELFYNPLRKAIIDMLRDTFSPQAGGASGGGVASFLGRVLGTMMGGGGAAAGGMPGPVVVPYGPAMASGGWVSGPGGPRDDKVPARLSNGEFVVQAKAARDWGPVLEAINRGVGVPGYASGGWVGDGAGASGGGVNPAALRPISERSGAGSPPELKVEFHDHTGQNLRKEVTPTSEGMRVDLYEQVGRSMISNAAQNGDLVKALQRSPSGHKKRG